MLDRVRAIKDEYAEYNYTDVLLRKYLGHWYVCVRSSHCGGTEYSYPMRLTLEQAKEVLRAGILDTLFEDHRQELLQDA